MISKVLITLSFACGLVRPYMGASRIAKALLHKSAIGQGIPNPKKIYAAATVWGVPRSVN